MKTWTLEDNGSDDIIDPRDIETRIEELSAQDAAQDGDSDLGLEEDERAELAKLTAFMDELGGNDYTMIRDSYFEDYARQLASDIGAIADDAKWPCTCIDWERAARELRMDYSSIELDGVDYWYN